MEDITSQDKVNQMDQFYHFGCFIAEAIDNLACLDDIWSHPRLSYIFNLNDKFKKIAFQIANEHLEHKGEIK